MVNLSIKRFFLYPIDPTTAAELLAQQIENRQQLIRDVIEKEHDFIEEMQNLFHVYLEPLEHAEM